MESVNPVEVTPQWLGETGRQYRHTILGALAVTDGDLATREINILHPESATLEKAKPAAIHQGSHEPGSAAKTSKHRRNLEPREDLRHPDGPLGARHLVKAFEVTLEHLAELCCRRSYVA